MQIVNDPNLISQLDAHDIQSNGTPVTDPNIIAQLESLSPETSVVGAAGRGALDALPFGTKAAAGIQSAVGNGSYDQYLAELDKLLAADKEQHPIAHYGGEAAGTVAPFLIPGVGEALGAESLAGRAGVGAGLGAIQAASNTRAPISSPEAMKEIAMGAGTGALINPAVGALGDALSSAGSKIADSSIADRANAAAFSKANGLNPLSLRRLAQIEGTNPEAAVSDLANKLQTVVPADYYSPTSSINDKYEILQNMKNQAGKVIGAARKSAGEATAKSFPEGQSAIDDLLESALNYKDVANPEGAEALKNAAASLQVLQDKGELNFSSLHDIKSAVGKAYQNPMNVKPGTDEIYSALSENLNNALDNLSPSTGIDPALFQKAKETYALTSKVMPLMLRGAGREISSAFTPMKGAIGLGSLATGHPLGALAAGAKGLQELIAPELPANLAMQGKNVVSGLAGKAGLPVGNIVTNTVTNKSSNPSLNLNHPEMAKYRPMFQANAKGLTDPAEIEKSNSITDYVLSQRDPAYAQAKQRANDNPNAVAGEEPVKMADGGVVPSIMDVINETGNKVKGGYAGIGDLIAGNGLNQAASDVTNVENGVSPETTAGKIGSGFGGFFTPQQIALAAAMGPLMEGVQSFVPSEAGEIGLGAGDSLTPESDTVNFMAKKGSTDYWNNQADSLSQKTPQEIAAIRDAWAKEANIRGAGGTSLPENADAENYNWYKGAPHDPAMTRIDPEALERQSEEAAYHSETGNNSDFGSDRLNENEFAEPEYKDETLKMVDKKGNPDANQLEQWLKKQEALNELANPSKEYTPTLTDRALNTNTPSMKWDNWGGRSVPTGDPEAAMLRAEEKAEIKAQTSPQLRKLNDKAAELFKNSPTKQKIWDMMRTSYPPSAGHVELPTSPIASSPRIGVGEPPRGAVENITSHLNDEGIKISHQAVSQHYKEIIQQLQKAFR